MLVLCGQIQLALLDRVSDPDSNCAIRPSLSHAWRPQVVAANNRWVFADRTATQLDQLFEESCRLSVRLSVCL